MESGSTSFPYMRLLRFARNDKTRASRDNSMTLRNDYSIALSVFCHCEEVAATDAAISRS